MHILEMTNEHLENNETSNNIKTTRGMKYKEVISTSFPTKMRRALEGVYNKQRWVT